MKVKELIKKEIDVDVYDNVKDLCIAFCGPLKLTAEGKRHFAEVLEYDVTITERPLYGGMIKEAVVDVDGPDGVWQKKYRNTKEFFYSAAGYCVDSDWNKWFKED